MELLDSPIVELVKTQRVEKVRAAIFLKYGFVPTDEYCRDLIAFVEALGPSQEAIDEP
jgi:hypothetical protein